MGFGTEKKFYTKKDLDLKLKSDMDYHFLKNVSSIYRSRVADLLEKNAVPLKMIKNDPSGTSYTDGKKIVLGIHEKDLKQMINRQNQVSHYLQVTTHEVCHVLFTDFYSYTNRLKNVKSFYEKNDLGEIENALTISQLQSKIRWFQNVLEDGRIENLLSLEYPGIRHDFIDLNNHMSIRQSLFSDISKDIIPEFVMDKNLFYENFEALKMKDFLNKNFGMITFLTQNCKKYGIEMTDERKLEIAENHFDVQILLSEIWNYSKLRKHSLDYELYSFYDMFSEEFNIFDSIKSKLKKAILSKNTLEMLNVLDEIILEIFPYLSKKLFIEEFKDIVSDDDIENDSDEFGDEMSDEEIKEWSKSSSSSKSKTYKKEISDMTEDETEDDSEDETDDSEGDSEDETDDSEGDSEDETDDSEDETGYSEDDSEDETGDDSKPDKSGVDETEITKEKIEKFLKDVEESKNKTDEIITDILSEAENKEKEMIKEEIEKSSKEYVKPSDIKGKLFENHTYQLRESDNAYSKIDFTEILGLRRELIKLFSNPNRNQKASYNRKKGKLNKKQLSKIKSGKRDVFYKENLPKPVKSAAVAIACDRSGSMSGGKVANLKIATAKIEQLLMGIVPLRIFGFTFFGPNVVTHYNIRDFSDKSLINKSQAKDFSALSGNSDADSIFIATQELLKRSESNKILIIESDGLPAETDEAQVREAIKIAESNGIKVFCVYFEEDTNCSWDSINKIVKKNLIYMYGKNVLVCPSNQILPNLVKLMKKVLI